MRSWKYTAALALLSALFAASFAACDNPLDGYVVWCETQAVCDAELPSTVCDEERGYCVCPIEGQIFCYEFNECVPHDVCDPPPICFPADSGVPDGAGVPDGG